MSRNNRYKWMGIAFVLVLSSMAVGQTRGTLTGSVLDAKTGSSLYGANIFLKGTLLGAATDDSGQYTITNLPPDQYELVATMIGYKKSETSVVIRMGEQTRMNFDLQPTILQQPNMVVTASKRKQALEDATTTVEIMSLAEIQSRNVTTLDEALQNVSGFRVIKGQIDLRGSTGFNWSAGSRVLLMVDGHPMINGDTGGINWDAIPVEQIERVEIIKGAGSALYGSNAMAGMVNIITRNPSLHPETRVRLTWSFYDEPAYESWRWTDRFLPYKFFELDEYNPKHTLSYENMDVTHSRRIGQTGVLVNVGRKRGSGYQENGDYSRWNFMAKTKTRFSPNQTLLLTANVTLNNHGDLIQWITQDDPMAVPPEELGNRVVYNKANVHATFQNAVNHNFAYTVKGNWYRTDWQNDFQDNQDWAITDRYGTEIQCDYLIGIQAFTFGSEITHHHTSSAIYGNQNIWDFAVYGEDEIQFSPKLTMNIGSRYDYHQVMEVSSDQQLSPRLGLVFKPARGTAFRFSAGYGFRAPSIAEVFANIKVSGVQVIPNLELKEAERAWNFEISGSQIIDTKPGRDLSRIRFPECLCPVLSLDAAAFYSQYKNMIDVELNPEEMAYQFTNLGKARIRGIETKLKAGFLNGMLTGSVGYTYLDPENQITGKTLNYRSRHLLVTGGVLTLEAFRFGLDYRYASRMDEIINILGSGYDQRVPIHVIDIRMSYKWRNMEFGIDGKNIRNYHYVMRQRLLEPPRHYVFTVRTHF
ncbi:TonB-dependent receptor [candidate division KSB1 bacterium]|nr:TonB-dependent receptor [candidate division KSB1 bacterium]